ncbi:hypothetical protein EX30DRAFT_355680 [Ascodesmis nigricans]|uniref:ATP-grasp domain-containing protein n=1 Tax=Ascodesmis nigricans TaxID=341454 RepID=A0A4S2MT45_9PEZI|nr:hypothetical protein EX30DRAFT_355680 [Ascodesmis nigricans]
MCIPLALYKSDLENPLNILLTNGRFPVSLDLARQLKLLGHHVFVLDPMHYHVCKFSASVTKSFQVPPPRVDRRGFINATLSAVQEAKIHLIVGMHEELYYLAESKEPEITSRLIAPEWTVLLRLHNKWEFSKLLEEAGLDRPRAWLCRNMEDAKKLDRRLDLALKPVFGRASNNVYHLKPDEEGLAEDLNINEEEEYIAQEWLYGDRFCCYAVIREGRVDAFGVYPVEDTIDGSSCVYFRSISHPRILNYVQRLATFLPHQSLPYQASFDIIETPATSTSPSRLVAIECNPRATSGIHLFSGTPNLAHALTIPPSPSALSPSSSPSPSTSLSKRSLSKLGKHHTKTDLTNLTYPIIPTPNTKRQLAPGMMMWKKSERGAKAWLQHMKRLMGSKDVIFNKRDLWPSLMQPFLLTSYYEICREQKRKLPDMFQWELCWVSERPCLVQCFGMKR